LLEVAATATTEVRARRLDSHWRRRDDLLDRSKENVALLSLHVHTHAICGRRERNKNSLAASMGEAHTTRKNSFHLDL